VHRVCFALTLFHPILCASLSALRILEIKGPPSRMGAFPLPLCSIGAYDLYRWNPKVLLWTLLVAVSFCTPNGFFMFWGNYIPLIVTTIFILLGLVLLGDFGHSWSELCLENWEASSR